MQPDPSEIPDADPIADPGLLAMLLGQVAAGQAQAFEQLYVLSVSRVLRTVSAVLRDAGQADEVTQEVFLEVWRLAGNFDVRKGSAQSWMWRLAHSRAVDRVRHAQSRRANDHTYAQHQYEPAIDSVVEGVLRSADSAALHVALQQLSPLQREALQLTYFAGNTHSQASNLLGIPLPTLKNRILNGVIALRRHYEQNSSPSGQN